jgi:ankyrin repeat protein
MDIIDKHDEMENPDEAELDEEEIRTKGDWNQQLYYFYYSNFKSLKACQKGDYDYAKKCIEKKANILIEDKKKWTPLVWCSCKGHTSIVRLLLSRGASSTYN